MASPIQIVLNTENYEETRETSGGARKRISLQIAIGRFENTKRSSSHSSEPSQRDWRPIHKLI